MDHFSKKHTDIAKGAGILLMLWHHLFFNDPEYYGKFVSLKIINGIPVECSLALAAKVCVAVFLFLSGYGLSLSFAKIQPKTAGKTISFVIRHLKNLYISYWFIFLLFVPLGFLFGRDPVVIYRHDIRYFLEDFFGLTFLFHYWGGPTMNDTWWFMSIIIVYYLFFPVLFRLTKKIPETMTALAMFVSIFLPVRADLTCWLFPFVLGMYFAVKDLFSKISSLVQNDFNRIMSSAVLVTVLAPLRIPIQYNRTFFTYDGVFACSIIIFCFWFAEKTKIIGKILEIFGKYSKLIFLFHTFIFEYYFPRFIYSPRYAPLIFLLLAAVCLFLAVFLEQLLGTIKKGAERLFHRTDFLQLMTGG